MTMRPRALSWDEALKFNGKEGYRPKDSLEDREKALASLPGARSATERRWVVIAEERRSCAKHGDYTATQEELQPPTPLNKPFWTQCPACNDEIAMEQKAAAVSSVEMRKELDRMRLVGASVPEKHIDSDFWNFQHRVPKMDYVWNKLRRYADDLEEVVEVGRCAVLFGNPGTGKTHLGCAVLRALLLKLGGTGLYTTHGRFISRLKATMGKGSLETEAHVFADLARVDLLVIDEIGRGGTSPWERSQLFRVIDERYQRRCKPTIVISNLSMGELAAEIDGAGLERMTENGGLRLKFDWESQRIAKPEADA